NSVVLSSLTRAASPVIWDRLEEKYASSCSAGGPPTPDRIDPQIGLSRAGPDTVSGEPDRNSHNLQSHERKGAKKQNHRVADVEEFLADNSHGELNWPRVGGTGTAASPRARVFVWGELAVKVPIRLCSPMTPQIVARWRMGEAPDCDWSFGRPSLGGLVG